MNKLRFQTASGAVYAIDFDAMTWTRVGRVPILGLEGRDTGRLEYRPTILIGGGAVLEDTVAGYIRTTPVVLIEDISTGEAA